METFIHPTAIVDEGAQVGAGTKIWHFCHVMPGAEIGERCSVGQNVFVGAGVKIGNGCKIQNNVSIYEGVTLDEDVFCGPSMVFTNVRNPRSAHPVGGKYATTHVERGATLGGNCTIVCGVRVGKFAFIGAGAVLSRDAPDYGLMVGVPARRIGWVGPRGERLLPIEGQPNFFICPVSGEKFIQTGPDHLAPQTAERRS